MKGLGPAKRVKVDDGDATFLLRRTFGDPWSPVVTGREAIIRRVRRSEPQDRKQIQSWHADSSPLTPS